MKRQRFIGLAVTFLAIAGIVACSSTNPVSDLTGSTPSETTSTAKTEPTAGTPAQTPPAQTPTAEEPAGDNPGYLIEFGPNASFSITNKNDFGGEYRAYTTGFDNQDLELAFKVSGTVPPNKSWGDSFNTKCVQLDITQGGYAGRPLKGGAAYYDKNGKKFSPANSPEKVTECRTPPPPNCEPQWVVDESSSLTTGEWGACVESEDENGRTACARTREVTRTKYETNSCTQERRIFRAETREESEPCECDESCNEENNGYFTYSPAVWSGEVEEGACTLDGPGDVGGDAVVAGCHENGTQDWVIDYTCRENATGTKSVCRAAECPVETAACYYNVPGSNGEADCIAQPGYVSWNERNHLCGLDSPGYCNSNFNLNDGQSGDGCLKYAGGDTNCNGVKDKDED